jgi:ribosome-associated protein
LSTTAKLKVKDLTQQEAMMDVIVDSIRDIKGKNILKLDLRSLDAPTDFFIICEGESTTQVSSIADRISLRLKNEQGEYASSLTGKQESRWVCLDYFDVVIHVFHKEAREFYDLEDLWSDAKITEYATL